MASGLYVGNHRQHAATPADRRTPSPAARLASAARHHRYLTTPANNVNAQAIARRAVCYSGFTIAPLLYR